MDLRANVLFFSFCLEEGIINCLGKGENRGREDTDNRVKRKKKEKRKAVKIDREKEFFLNILYRCGQPLGI